MPGGTEPIQIEAFPLGPFETNCYLVWAPPSREAWVIDASFDAEPIADRARELGLDVRAIILTHAHVDHIAGLDALRAALTSSGAPAPTVLIHQAEAGFLGDASLNLSAMSGLRITARPADRLLAGGERLQLGSTTWEVLHTPGHSPGGVTLFWAGAPGIAPIALVGDTLFAGSIGRSDFPTSNHALLVDSIGRTLYELPGATRVLPGHGPPTTIDRERTSNPFVRAGAGSGPVR